MSFYRDYLRSDAWREKRREALVHARYRCQDCMAVRNLEVHHLTYERLGHEELSDLRVLYRSCHGERHGRSAPPAGMEPLNSILARVLQRIDANHSVETT